MKNWVFVCVFFFFFLGGRGVGGGGRPGHGCPWTPPGLLRLEGKGSQGCVPCPALPLCEEAGAAALSSG